MMIMIMVKLISYWIVVLKFILKLLFVFLKRLLKECMIVFGGSLSILRRYVLIVVCLCFNLVMIFIFFRLI